MLPVHLGELAMLCPEKTPKRLLVVVQSLLAGPSAMDGGEYQVLIKSWL